MRVHPAIFVLLGAFLGVSVICQTVLWVIRRRQSESSALTRTSSNISLSSKEPQVERWQQVLDIVSIAFIWYSISLSFTLFNKWFMQEWRGGFYFPIFIVSIHMSMKCLISMLWSVSPGAEKLSPLSWSTLFLVVFPIGALTAADVVLANTAILHLPLSIVTTIKGSTLIFTFLWGTLLEIETFQWSLLLAVVGITAGLGIAVSNSMEFNIFGFVLAFSSAACGGLRWALMQFLEVRDVQSKSVMVTLYRFSPASMFSVIPFAFIFEQRKIVQSSFFLHPKDLFDGILLCALGGCIAFLLIIAEVKLVRLTSSLTMSVFGQVKEIIQILLAMIIFKENLTLKCIFGISMSIMFSCYYRYIVEAREEETATEGDSQNGSANINDSNSMDHQLKEQELSLLRSVDHVFDDPIF